MSVIKKKIVILLPDFFISSAEGEAFKAHIDDFLKIYGAEYEAIIISSDMADKDILSEASVIIGNPPPNILCKCTKLEWLQLDFAGTDRYIDAVRNIGRSIIFTNASGAFGRVISEHMLAVIMALYKKLPEYIINQKEHIWQDMGCEATIYDKNILIIGTGDIGTSFANIMRPFDSHITGINRRGRKNDGFDITDTLENLEKYVEEADIIACCVPKNNTTDNIISEKVINKMKKSAIVINVGRGNCIDEDALVRALNEGLIAGAALDVFVNEPLDKNSEIWNAKNLIITPHISGKTYGHLNRTVNIVLDICLKNLYRYVRGENLINQVDLETGYRI